jgi:hypothetical protein
MPESRRIVLSSVSGATKGSEPAVFGAAPGIAMSYGSTIGASSSPIRVAASSGCHQTALKGVVIHHSIGLDWLVYSNDDVDRDQIFCAKSRLPFSCSSHQRRCKMNVKVLGAVVAVLAIGGALTIAAPKPAAALPAYAASTGKACGACHVNPAGGGPRNAFGDAFAANGHKLPAKK